MKATGIVRRIDDLGRVVIPKEIRRTMRIREGDPLEIYTDNEGGVIFKKYSPIGEMSDFATQYADVLYKTCGFPAAVCDRDHIIAVSGASKRDLMERRAGQILEGIMEKRKAYVYKRGEGDALYPFDGFDRTLTVAVPIISSGDITGCVVLFSSDENKYAGETELKLCQAAASFLGKQMEE